MTFAAIVLALTGLVVVYVILRLAYRVWRGDVDEPAGRDSDSFRA
jgi:hypothetical protein